MAKYTFKEIVKQARLLKKNVETEYKMGMNSKWSYYFAKAIISVNTDVTRISFEESKNPYGTHISRQIPKKDCFDICRRLIKYVESNKKMPNYVAWGNYKLAPRLLIYGLARMLIYYVDNGKFPKYVNFNDKCYMKPSESHNEVYEYFVKVFGSISCIDDALDKIGGNGYGYYYDDVYSNKTSIDRMANGYGVNCTDSCQVFYNIALELIKQGKYKKVQCLHIHCSGGDGHVRLRIQLNDGDWIYRDPACTLSNGGYCNWCSDGELLAVDPSWFKENLNR